MASEVKKMATTIQGLQERLQTLLRESAAGNRRNDKRYEMESPVPAQVTYGNTTYECGVRDMTIHGVALVNCGFEATVNQKFTIQLPNYGNIIEATVLGVEEDRVRVGYQLPATDESDFEIYIKSLSAQYGKLVA